MTVAYASDVSVSQSVPWIHNLLLRWKGSVYKLVFNEFIVYCVVYLSISLSYQFALNEKQRDIFGELVKFCEQKKSTIPLSFLLGFFVAAVVARWWQLWSLIPWLNKIAFLIQCLVIGRGKDKATKVRLVLIRYINLSWVLLMRQVSDQVRNRFGPCSSRSPKDLMKYTTTDLLDGLNKDPKVRRTFGKIISETEIASFQKIGNEFISRNPECPYEPEFWIPLRWAARLLNKSQKCGLIYDLRTTSQLIMEIENLREQMQSLLIQSKILLPLVYTQVVIIMVYSYFLLQIMTSQYIDNQRNHSFYFPLHFPVLSVFEFIFIVGWLKVAMCVINPFGQDDEDFQTSAMLDYNLNLSYRCATAHDDMYPDYLKHPNIVYSLPLGFQSQHADANEYKKFLEELEMTQSELAREYAAFQSEICKSSEPVRRNRFANFLNMFRNFIRINRFKKKKEDQLSLYSTRRYSFNENSRSMLHPRTESHYHVISVDATCSRL